VKHVTRIVRNIHLELKCTFEFVILFGMVVNIMCSVNSVKDIIRKMLLVTWIKWNLTNLKKIVCCQQFNCISLILLLYCNLLHCTDLSLCFTIYVHLQSMAILFFSFLSILFSFLFFFVNHYMDRLYGLVVRVSGYRSRGPVSIPSASRFSEK
jgi:hypothetical protein